MYNLICALSNSSAANDCANTSMTMKHCLIAGKLSHVNMALFCFCWVVKLHAVSSSFVRTRISCTYALLCSCQLTHNYAARLAAPCYHPSRCRSLAGCHRLVWPPSLQDTSMYIIEVAAFVQQHTPECAPRYKASSPFLLNGF